MPRVQFNFQSRNINIVKDMRSPKRISQVSAWFKEARKVVPEIPAVGPHVGIVQHTTITDEGEKIGWVLTDENVTQKFIRWDITNSLGERCYVVIARKQGSSF